MRTAVLAVASLLVLALCADAVVFPKPTEHMSLIDSREKIVEAAPHHRSAATPAKTHAAGGEGFPRPEEKLQLVENAEGHSSKSSKKGNMAPEKEAVASKGDKEKLEEEEASLKKEIAHLHSKEKAMQQHIHHLKQQVSKREAEEDDMQKKENADEKRLKSDEARTNPKAGKKTSTLVETRDMAALPTVTELLQEGEFDPDELVALYRSHRRHHRNQEDERESEDDDRDEDRDHHSRSRHRRSDRDRESDGDNRSSTRHHRNRHQVQDYARNPPMHPALHHPMDPTSLSSFLSAKMQENKGGDADFMESYGKGYTKMQKQMAMMQQQIAESELQATALSMHNNYLSQSLFGDSNCLDKDDYRCQTKTLMGGMAYLMQSGTLPEGGLSNGGNALMSNVMAQPHY